MSSPREVPPEARLESLLARYLEGELPPDEDNQLAGLLAARPKALDEALRLIRQNEELRDLLSPEAAPERLGAAVVARLKASGHSRRFATGLVKALRMRGPPAAAAGRRRASAYIGWAAAAAVVLAAAGAFLLLRGRRQEPAWKAEIVSVQGQAELRRDASTLAASIGTRLLPGDRLTTGADGGATLRFDGEATDLELGGAAQLRLTAEDGAKRLSLDRGRLKAQVAPQPAGRPMVLASPQAQALVLGTTLEFRVTQDASRLEVSQGLVRFRRLDRPVELEVGPGGYALALPETTLSASARLVGPNRPLRLIEDHEGPLAWQQSLYSAPLAFEVSPSAHGGRNGLRIVYAPQPSDALPYGSVDHPLALQPGERALQFHINVQSYEGNSNWNIQVRQRDMTCWHIGGGRLADLAKGWNLVEVEIPRTPANAYGGGKYRPEDVWTLIFSVCQRPATFAVDDFAVVGGGRQ